MYISARKPQEEISVLVILPFHVSPASQRAYSRLLETYKGFAGPELAFMGDFDELSDVDPVGADDSSPRVLEPAQNRLVEMRTQLLSSLSRTRSRCQRTSGGSTAGSEPSSDGGLQRGSPIRAELVAQLSAVRSLKKSEPVPLTLAGAGHVGPSAGLISASEAVARYVAPGLRAEQPSLGVTATVPTSQASNLLGGISAVEPIAHALLPPDRGVRRFAESEVPLGIFGQAGNYIQPEQLSGGLHNINITATGTGHLDTNVASLMPGVAPTTTAPGPPATVPSGGNALSFEDLLSAAVVSHGLTDLVTGAIDGLTLRDPASPSYPGREMMENYSGNSTDSASRKQMQRIMQSDTLGASSEFQYTPFQERAGDLIQDGATLRVKDKLQFPRVDRFLSWCRRRCEDWERIRDSGIGVFTYNPDPASPFKAHYRTAVMIVARYEFLMELVEYVRTEMPHVPFEATYVLITSYYVTARWTKQPFTTALSEDRDLLRLGSEKFTTVSARRENLRRLVMESFPTVAFQRVLARTGYVPTPMVQGAGLLPAPPQSGVLSPPSGAGAVVPPVASRPCPLCGSSEHSYYAGNYTHTGTITRACNRVKRVDGVKMKCVKKHAFSGPLMTPCDYTETV
ncbi:hypothetical protein CYMTET_16752 [Cymbomonas tetramitiformis]|uniref:Uncharacterized protein n=1 Tax=Cymbomonas tetramitiformis TaxID=36881 RepID=A0AAE0L810_9CHLO|nr:hypothetical protein CYMTET_16752 [Cymbomonas tetramitiformis]